MVKHSSLVRVKRSLGLFLGALIVLGCAGCGTSEWAGPEWEKQKLGTESIENARQLAGYPAADGKRVKDKVLLRSGALFGASQADLETLREEYGLRAVIDLRTGSEAAEEPDPVMEGVAYYHLPLMEEDGKGNNRAAVLEIYRRCGHEPGRAFVEMARAGALAEDMYSSFLDSEETLAAWRQFFDVLLEQEEGAVLWHCTGGKDRAGLTTAILLTVLGADEETVIADFALSNEAFSGKISYITGEAARYTSDPGELAQVEALVGVAPELMRMAFDRAEEECGSMLGFVRQKIGLTDEEVAALRDRYLE